MSEVSLKKAAAGQDGKIVIVRPSALATEGKTGTVAEGVFEKMEPNKFNPEKNDYFIRDTKTDTLYIINSTQALKDQLEQEGVLGKKVRIEYAGKLKTKKSAKGYHDFSCFLVK